MSSEKITLHEFVEKYVARNSLCRLWKPLDNGNKLMILKEPYYGLGNSSDSRI